MQYHAAPAAVVVFSTDKGPLAVVYDPSGCRADVPAGPLRQAARRGGRVVGPGCGYAPKATLRPGACITDWTTEATDAVERVVSRRCATQTVVPAKSISRVVVYGMLAALVVLPAVILLVIGLFRGLVLLYQGKRWAAWLTLGGICVIAGAFGWSRSPW